MSNEVRVIDCIIFAAVVGVAMWTIAWLADNPNNHKIPLYIFTLLP